jgi:hypothetical protein
MNPLLFADWGRMNRLFTRVMWVVAVAMLCAVCVALATPVHAPHGTPTARSVTPAAAAAGASSAR